MILNLSFERWNEVFNEAALTVAIVDRLIDSHISKYDCQSIQKTRTINVWKNNFLY